MGGCQASCDDLPNAGLMLAQRSKQCASINQALGCSVEKTSTFLCSNDHSYQFSRHL